jgi:hypothetical protein
MVHRRTRESEGERMERVEEEESVEMEMKRRKGWRVSLRVEE